MGRVSVSQPVFLGWGWGVEMGRGWCAQNNAVVCMDGATLNITPLTLPKRLLIFGKLLSKFEILNSNKRKKKKVQGVLLALLCIADADKHF